MKMIVLMRADLGMGKGKMIAQGAHAVVGLIRKHMKELRLQMRMNSWEGTGATKIVLKVMSLDQLTTIVGAANLNHLETYIVTDAAKTFFKEPTTTCAAIGPASDEDIDLVTGSLPLL